MFSWKKTEMKGWYSSRLDALAMNLTASYKMGLDKDIK